jgi:hypothetical protein
MEKNNIEDGLESRLRKWIENKGIPLEMKTAQLFQKLGYEISSSVNYKDSETSKIREIDIIARKYHLMDEHIFFCINFVIECKYSQNRPWILFKQLNKENKKEEYSTFHTAFGNYYGDVALLELYPTDYLKNPLFKIEREPYYSIRQSLIDNKDIDSSYIAIKQLLNAIISLKEREHKDKFFANIYIPLVIVDGQLYECYLTDNSGIEIRKNDFGMLMISKAESNYGQIYIRVVSYDYLDNYLIELDDGIENLLNNIGAKIPETLSMMKS